METEDQILRQQAFLNSSVRKMSEHLAITTPVENGHHVSEENNVCILFIYCYCPCYIVLREESTIYRNHRVLHRQKSLVQSL